MTANFLLGIGGTGAKCVEAFARLSFCGLGPDEAWIGLLDQDRSNGNAGRAVRVLEDMNEVRRALRTQGANDLGPCKLLGTHVEKPKAGWAWAPEEKSSTTLERSIAYGGLPWQQAALADVLFSAEERRLQLDEGFRQRPALGAALTLQGVTANSPVWHDLLGALQSGGQGEEVRVLIAASVFGGTGASGFPTVARLLRKAIKDRGLSGQVKLAGVLMLPYFAFPTPPPGEGPAIRPDSSVFLMQARGALEYYATLFSKEQVFDTLYLLGSDPLVQFNAYSDGGTNQANPPLLPEFVGGLAALDFLAARSDPNRGIVATRTDGKDVVSWDDLPDAGARGTVRRHVAAAIRTAVAWRQQYAPALMGDAWQSFRRETWFKRQVKQPPGKEPRDDDTQRAITLMTKASEDLLRWFVALNRLGAGPGRRLDLLSDSLLARDWNQQSIDHVPLTSVSSSDFRNLVPGIDGITLADLFTSLSYDPPASESAGIGRLIASIHNACSPRRNGGA
ncbi:tubulin-like doman-containing protein [Neoroseomonas rubea]|uniref:tubulin-like doman-containing protein n=1 Tax=Neoroseomonas rubea TaxID=2748666 RepID=UPI0018E05BBC|nr:tubulin-like doman-containing protein [Roseomonas rubea]